MAWEVRLNRDSKTYKTYMVYDDENWYVMSSQDERRAQLVASAPKMLEALEAIRDKADHIASITRHGSWGDWEIVKKLAHAAIAAAKENSNEAELV